MKINEIDKENPGITYKTLCMHFKIRRHLMKIDIEFREKISLNELFNGIKNLHIDLFLVEFEDMHNIRNI